MRDSLPLQIKSHGDLGQFTAYASTFDGEPDGHGDVVRRGAFKKSLEVHRANGTAPALLWHHDQTQPIGVITNAYEDAKGLRIDGQLALDTQKGAEAFALMRLSALSMSIGYTPIESSPLGRRGRELKKIALHEVSAVAMPSNINAKVLSVKEARRTNPTTVEKIIAASAAIRKFI